MTTISINFPTICSSGTVEILAMLALTGLAISGVARIFAILSYVWDLFGISRIFAIFFLALFRWIDKPRSKDEVVDLWGKVLAATIVIVGTTAILLIFIFYN